MKNVKSALAEDVLDQVAEVAYRARYSELLTPSQWAEHAAQVHKSCRERGYVIRSELSYDDVLRLTRVGRSNSMRIGTLTRATSSPMVLIAAQAEGIEYRWAVPLSTPDGAAWLREGLERRRFLIAVESTSMPVVGMLYLCAEASDNLQRLAEPLEGPSAGGTPSSEELIEAAVWLSAYGFGTAPEDCCQFRQRQESMNRHRRHPLHRSEGWAQKTTGHVRWSPLLTPVVRSRPSRRGF